MADIDVVSGEQILIKIETAPGSGVFDAPCLINTDRGLEGTANLVTTPVPKCGAPGDVAVNRTDKDSVGWTISGAGLLDVGDVPLFYDYLISPDTRNIEVWVRSVGGSKFLGAFHLNQFSITGTRKQKATCSIGLTADGLVTRTDT